MSSGVTRARSGDRRPRDRAVRASCLARPAAGLRAGRRRTGHQQRRSSPRTRARAAAPVALLRLLVEALLPGRAAAAGVAAARRRVGAVVVLGLLPARALPRARGAAGSHRDRGRGMWMCAAARLVSRKGRCLDLMILQQAAMRWNGAGCSCPVGAEAGLDVQREASDVRGGCAPGMSAAAAAAVRCRWVVPSAAPGWPETGPPAGSDAGEGDASAGPASPPPAAMPSLAAGAAAADRGSRGMLAVRLRQHSRIGRVSRPKCSI